MAKFEIRETASEDLESIVELLSKGELPENRDADYLKQWWQWLTVESPSRIQKVLAGVEDGGRLVGHFGVFSFNFLIKGEDYSGGRISPFVAVEEFQEMQFIARLESRLLKEYADEGIDFAYGLLSRPRELETHLYCGFREVSKFPIYMRPYKLVKIARRRLTRSVVFKILLPFLSIAENVLNRPLREKEQKIEVQRITAFDETFDEFLGEAPKWFIRSSARSRELLNWRFFGLAGRRYRVYGAFDDNKPLGYFVVRRMEMKGFDVLALVDILYDPRKSDVEKALFREIHEIALDQQVDMCACLMNPKAPYSLALYRRAFVPSGESVSFIVHKPKERNFDFSLLDKELWHMTWFDHDFV